MAAKASSSGNKQLDNLVTTNAAYRTNANAYPHSVGVTTAPTYNVTTSVPTQGSLPSKNQGIVGSTTPGWLDKYTNTGSGSKSGSSSGSKSGSGSSSGSSSGTGSYGAYMQLAAAQAAANQQRAAEAAAAMRAAAQNAYDRGMSNLNAAFDSRMRALGDNFNSTKDQLGQALNSSTDSVNKDADRSLKQAYINRMMNERNLNQQLSSQGLSGGATESTLARLYNNYGNSRNSIEGTRADNLTDLNNTYNTNLASALQAYNNAVADAEAQRAQMMNNLENALANGQISAEENYQNALNSNNSAYMDALGNALDQMNRYNFTPSEVLNDIQLANVIQNAYNTSSNYKNAINQGMADSGVTNGVLDATANNNYLAALLRSLYNA